MSAGILYGVGVGPGDPELMTLKAARILREARIVAYFAKQGGAGRAHSIAASMLAANCEEIPFAYPLTTEVAVDDPRYTQAMGEFYESCAERIAQRLNDGSDVVAICEGNPFFYGSFMHLYRRLQAHFTCRVVPGVTAMSGCWTAAGIPVVWGDDTLVVLPGTLPEEALCERLHGTDAAVIMKIGRHLPKVRAALERSGMLERAMYIEYGTAENQLLMPLKEKQDDAPYFSLVVVPGSGRQL